MSGSEYFDRLLKLIDQAKHSLHIQFYIFDADKTGLTVLDALKKAAQRGVKVLLIVDGYASDKLTSELVQDLKQHGIFFKRFSPIKTYRFRVGRRMHHKIVLIDEQVALIGGLNIADKYSGYHGETAWLDFGVEVTGLICKDIKRICESVWPKHIIKKLWNELPRTATTIDGSTTLRLLQNDWWRRRIEISAFYKDAIMHAQHEIIIAASYFFPGNRIRKQLQQAHKRGVRIRLLLAGRSDVILLKPAIRYLYDWLLRNEIEIYEWQPSVMHGKMAIIDRQLTTIGSYNLNALSDYGSMELNVLAANESFSKMCGDKLDQLIQSGTKQITFQEFKRSSNLVLRFYRWFSYQLIRSSLAVLFIFMQRSRMLNRIPN